MTPVVEDKEKNILGRSLYDLILPSIDLMSLPLL